MGMGLCCKTNSDDKSNEMKDGIIPTIENRVEDNRDLKISSYIFNSNYYMFTRLVVPNTEEAYSYDTERVHFIGRNHTANNPVGINKPLTNYIGDNLDPIMSMRNRIVIPPNGSIEIYLHMGFGRSREQILEIINKNYNKI